MKTLKTIITVMSVVCLLGCSTDIDLCQTQHPHQADLHITYDWRNVSAATVPDSMVVLAERLVNRWNCGYAISTADYGADNLFNGLIKNIEEIDEAEKEEEESEGSENTEYSEYSDYSEDSENSEDSETSSSAPHPVFPYATVPVKNGQYMLMTFNRDPLEFNYDGVDQYLNNYDEDASLSEIYVEYNSYDISDPRLRQFSPSWTDFNPYTNYVQSDALPFLYQVSTLFKVSDQQQQDVQLTPRSLMQHITVNFDVQKIYDNDHSFVIDSILAEISGIPHRFYIVRNELDATKTYKMMLQPARYTAGSATVDTYSNWRLHYSASFYAPGVVPALSPRVAMGPGILQVKIYLHSDSHPSLSQHPINARLNLFNSLTAEPLIRMNEAGTAGQIIGTERTINISTLLRIDGAAILKSEEEGELNQWQQCYEGINVDI